MGNIYLDHNATSFLHPAVKKLVIKSINGGLNASSIHANGRYARKVIEEAREQIKKSVGLDKNSREHEVIFTSSGTESNNLIMNNYYDGDIFISAIEHLSIYNHRLYAPNFQIIKVDNEGVLDLDHLSKLLSQSTKDKKLVSVMLANNESGVLQDIKAISHIAKKYKAEFHSDCVQALGRVEFDMQDLDFCTTSSHKIGGMQGSSALIARSKYPVKPMIIGGGQEKNIRSGTENIASIASFGLAASIATRDLQKNARKMCKLQSYLEQGLQKYTNVKIVSKNVKRLPNTTLIIVPKTEAQVKLIAFDLHNICVSSGSACSSGVLSKSHVLANMGISDEESKSSIRVSLGNMQTVKDINMFLKAFKEIYKQELV